MWIYNKSLRSFLILSIIGLIMLPNTIIPEYLLNSYIFKLFVASLWGAFIGFERDLHGRAAGLRTHLLVSLGSAVFMILSESIAVSYSKHITDTLLRADPSRIAAQIITGIFLLQPSST